jgi:hypothetical protein
MPHLYTGTNHHCPKEDRGNCIRADSGRSCSTHQNECTAHNWVWMPDLDKGCFYCNTGIEPGGNKPPAPTMKRVKQEKWEKKTAKRAKR